MSLGTRTLAEETDRPPLSTADGDLKLSLGFLDSGAKAATRKKQISGE